MKLNIIKHQNNIEVKNYSKVLTTMNEINRVKNSIFLYISNKKQNVITRGLPYRELTEGGFGGFVSDMFQVITTSTSQKATPTSKSNSHHRAKLRHSHSQPDNPQERLPNIG